MGEDAGMMTTEQVAALCRRVCGEGIRPFCEPVSGQQVRKYCHDGVLQGLGIRTRRTGKWWGIEREDLLRVMHEALTTGLARLEEEMERE